MRCMTNRKESLDPIISNIMCACTTGSIPTPKANQNPIFFQETDQKPGSEQTFITTRGAFAADLKMTGGENPQSAHSISVPAARASAHHLHKVCSFLEPTDLAQLLSGEQQPTLSLRHISHPQIPQTRPRSYERKGKKTNWVSLKWG